MDQQISFFISLWPSIQDSPLKMTSKAICGRWGNWEKYAGWPGLCVISLIPEAQSYLILERMVAEGSLLTQILEWLQWAENVGSWGICSPWQTGARVLTRPARTLILSLLLTEKEIYHDQRGFILNSCSMSSLSIALWTHPAYISMSLRKVLPEIQAKCSTFSNFTLLIQWIELIATC